MVDMIITKAKWEQDCEEGQALRDAVVQQVNYLIETACPESSLDRIKLTLSIQKYKKKTYY